MGYPHFSDPMVASKSLPIPACITGENSRCTGDHNLDGTSGSRVCNCDSAMRVPRAPGILRSFSKSKNGTNWPSLTDCPILEFSQKTCPIEFQVKWVGVTFSFETSTSSSFWTEHDFGISRAKGIWNSQQEQHEDGCKADLRAARVDVHLQWAWRPTVALSFCLRKGSHRNDKRCVPQPLENYSTKAWYPLNHPRVSGLVQSCLCHSVEDLSHKLGPQIAAWKANTSYHSSAAKF